MSSNGWKSYKLGEVATFYNGRAYKNEEFKKFGTPIVRIQNLTGEGKTVYSDLELDANKYIEAGDLIYAWSATFGPYIWKGPRSIYHYHIWKIECNDQLLDKQYLYYKLKVISDSLQDRGNGTLFVHITKAFIESFEISIPPVETQRRVANILSTLDEKIELNRQTNATLEGIAQSVFKEWFVDFNFPSATGENVESELGSIPKGWRVGSILDIANLLSGGTPSTQIEEYWNGQIKWVSAKDVSNAQGTFVLDTERKVSQMGIDNSSTKLLPALTTIVTARGTVGSYCILAEPMTMNQTNYGLKAKTENTDYFVFFSLSNLVAHLRQVSYGTIFDTVTTKTFEQSRIFIPPAQVIQEFDSRIKPIMQNILNNLQQSATLAALRDALLPKLMSGEIEV